ncbi:MAG: Crp/Fnr family transcriptional regulator [Clostridiales bacterium]|nr:Crp/Fnr family transcriptional regulator [Clostridiales bacterium]
MNLEKLTHTPLFRGIQGKELEAMIQCLGGYTRTFQKDSIIYRQGEQIREVGVVLSGRVHMVKGDIWGKEGIIGQSGPGQAFGEAYACRSEEPLQIDVVAVEDTEVLFLSLRKMLMTCSSGCRFHNRMIQNFVYALAGKNLNLSRKIDCISPRGVRERILAYLSYEAVKQESYTLEIPFSRQQMADYLAVDRSALSNELSRMQKEGLISYKKNRFELL